MRSPVEMASFEAVLEHAPSEESGGEWDEFYGEPNLRLDVEKIDVFQIRTVSYRTSKRSVSRYRRPADEKLPF
jgi:hypothetical protein